MKLLEDSKTNWKRIIVVLVLIVLSVSAFFGLLFFQEQFKVVLVLIALSASVFFRSFVFSRTIQEGICSISLKTAPAQ